MCPEVSPTDDVDGLEPAVEDGTGTGSGRVIISELNLGTMPHRGSKWRWVSTGLRDLWHHRVGVGVIVMGDSDIVGGRRRRHRSAIGNLPLPLHCHRRRRQFFRGARSNLGGIEPALYC
jgi:hypothetical protein